MRTVGTLRLLHRRRGSFAPCLLVFALLGLGASDRTDARSLLEEGHAAFARGDYAAAAALYEQAEIYSTDPAETAFYLASAKYQLALKTEGPSPELREAEQLYRCCLRSSDPRRPHALYGLGNCLLRKVGERDIDGLRAAISCYDQCLQCAGEDAALAADARYNREKARLLLLQCQPPINGTASDRPPEDDPFPRPFRQDRPPLSFPNELSGPNGEGNARDAGTVDTAQGQGTGTDSSDQPPSPGKGNLEPIPDKVDVPPLSPHDAAEHLQSASKKVMQERQTHHRRVEPASATGVKDW